MGERDLVSWDKRCRHSLVPMLAKLTLYSYNKTTLSGRQRRIASCSSRCQGWYAPIKKRPKTQLCFRFNRARSSVRNGSGEIQ